jgi:hypothetical protein
VEAVDDLIRVVQLHDHNNDDTHNTGQDNECHEVEVVGSPEQRCAGRGELVGEWGVLRGRWGGS